MVLSDDPNDTALKTDTDKLMEEVGDKLLDFGDFISTSKLTVKPEPAELETEKIPLEAAEEVIAEEPVLFPTRSLDTSGVSPAAYLTDIGSKKYKLFICPEMLECVKLCKTFIGQGTTICMNENCLKNHRQKRTVSISCQSTYVSSYVEFSFLVSSK